MEMTLDQFVDDFSGALLEVDRAGKPHKHFQPGIGPYGEADAIRAALAILKTKNQEWYASAVMKRQPDLLIPGHWQIEFKVIRPFGDNGKEAENWSQNVLHPYPGNVSSLGDCFKLIRADGTERKAVVVFGYEHDLAKISLDPCIRGFELLAADLLQMNLSGRVERRVTGLIHPVHQVLRVFAWEVSGAMPTAAAQNR